MTRIFYSILRAVFICGLLGLLTIATPVLAEQKEPNDLFEMSLEELMSLEITSSARRLQPVTRATSAVFVITAEDIRQAGPVRIEDLLRLVPGMDVFWKDGVTSAIGCRGFIQWSNKGMQVLLDGRPLYDPYLGGELFFLNPIPLEDIERIEVIRGSAGVTWGVNAMNGVVNIITKKAADTQGGLGYGAFGNREFQQGYLRYGGTNGPLAWRGTVATLHDEGFGLDHGNAPAGNSWNGPISDYYEPFEATGRGDLKLSEDTTLSFSGGHKYSPISGHNTLTNRSVQYMNLLWEKAVSDSSSWKIRWSESYIRRTGTNHYNDIDVRSREEMLELQHNFVHDRHSIVWGADYTRDVYKSRTLSTAINTVPEDFINDQASAFIEDEITLADNLWFTIGYRGHYNELTHFDWAGRTALVWEFTPKHFLRGAISRAFRRPTMWEEFRYAPDIWSLSGNDSLRNERMVSYEIGYRGQWAKNLSVNIEGYINKHKDIIAKKYDDLATWTGYRWQNVYDVTTYGLETDVEWKPFDWWFVRAFHVYLHQTDRNQLTNYRSGETESYLPPKHRMGLTNRFSIDKATTLNTQLYWTDTSTEFLEYIGGRAFWKLDVRLARRFWNDSAEIAIGAMNLLDHFHYEGGYDWTTNEYVEAPRLFYFQFFYKF